MKNRQLLDVILINALFSYLWVCVMCPMPFLTWVYEKNSNEKFTLILYRAHKRSTWFLQSASEPMNQTYMPLPFLLLVNTLFRIFQFNCYNKHGKTACAALDECAIVRTKSMNIRTSFIQNCHRHFTHFPTLLKLFCHFLF